MSASKSALMAVLFVMCIIASTLSNASALNDHAADNLVNVFSTNPTILLSPLADTISEEDWKLRSARPELFYNDFKTNIAIIADRIDDSAKMRAVSDRFFHIFVVILIINLMVRFVFATGVGMADILFTIIHIGIIRILMITFNDWTNAIWNAGVFVADEINKAALPDVVGVVDMLQELALGVGSLVLDPVSWLTLGISAAIMSTIYGFFTFLFIASSVFASLWGMWGLVVAKCLGLFLIPFALFEKMSFLFDGWMRFFLGFVFYYIIARVNIILGLLATRAFFFNLGDDGQVHSIGYDNPMQSIGLLGFMMIAALALLSTGQFAASMVGGAGGFAQAARGLAFFAMRNKVTKALIKGGK